jgi:hypothetical protein
MHCQEWGFLFYTSYGKTVVMTINPPCTIEHLRTSFSYDTATGIFTWLLHKKRPDLIGTRAGSKHSAGYWAIAIHNRKQLAHRLAWAYVTGEWPLEHIDHINGNKLDNRFCNLRQVSRFGNLQNMRKATKKNTIGLLGVSAHQGKWRAQIMTTGVITRKSGFDTPEAAHEAYLELKRRLHDTCSI